MRRFAVFRSRTGTKQRKESSRHDEYAEQKDQEDRYRRDYRRAGNIHGSADDSQLSYVRGLYHSGLRLCDQFNTIL